jgi:FixJ family two-component response regulator
MSTNGTSICLLDDDASVLKATSRMLSYAGYRVQQFIDPTTFLTYAFDHQPCVAVLDILMRAMKKVAKRAAFPKRYRRLLRFSLQLPTPS